MHDILDIALSMKQQDLKIYHMNDLVVHFH